jgi:putative nucleotidyltransferase with HDIG domain
VREKLTLPLAAVAGSLLVPALVIAFFGSPAEDSHAIYVFHFAIVLLTTAVAGAASAWLTAIGARRRDARAVLVGAAFSSMAALLFIHGLATPDVILEEGANDSTPLLAFAGGATLPVGGAILALAAWPQVLRPAAVPHLLRMQAAVLAAIIALGTFGMLDQTDLPSEPAPRSAIAWLLFVLGIALLAAVAWRALRTFILTRRVAELAVQVGEELGVPPHRLRSMAIGGLLHDIGKLQIPDAILKKPGPLDDGEYEVVQHHPDWGDRLARELGLPPRVRALIRHHHERLDGTGYPDRLVSEQLALDVRILAVCDVYDALISKRVYRDAWSPAQALRTLKAEEGTAFDGRCVAALERVVSAQPPEPSRSRVPAAAHGRLAHN